jgi:hypothetical protein
MGSFRMGCCAVALFAGSAGVQASAHWVCNVSEAGTQLICVADAEPSIDAAAKADPGFVTAMVKGTRFPLDPARIYRVDMWSPPTDAEFVALLARATICYRSPGCQVTLAPGPWLSVAGRRP